MQGTKVLEDREIRSDFGITSKDTPSQRAFSSITKYTGALAAPKWTDVEPGRVFSFSWYLVKSAQSPKDKFETLCHVEADISRAPFISRRMTEGMSYRREYAVILLVGLTELKAQVSWVDERTVRAHTYLRVPVHLIRIHMRESRGQREGL